jgi:hypothetical protein
MSTAGKHRGAARPRYRARHVNRQRQQDTSPPRAVFPPAGEIVQAAYLASLI